MARAEPGRLRPTRWEGRASPRPTAPLRRKQPAENCPEPNGTVVAGSERRYSGAGVDSVSELLYVAIVDVVFDEVSSGDERCDRPFDEVHGGHGADPGVPEESRLIRQVDAPSPGSRTDGRSRSCWMASPAVLSAMRS
jgi:hypothetical protein